MPGLPKGPSSVTQSILPVSAQEPAAPPPAPGTPLPMTGTILTPTPQAAPAPPAAGELNIMPPNMPTNAAPPAAVKSTPKQPANCPWNLTVEIVGGRTLLTAQNGEDVKFTVSCEKLDMATPSGSIQAWGKVKLSTDSIEGNCEKLTISWQEDVVTLEKVQLKFKLEGHEADLNAEQLRVRLSRVVSSAREEQACSLWGFFR
jgi:hypothetical protein